MNESRLNVECILQLSDCLSQGILGTTTHLLLFVEHDL